MYRTILTVRICRYVFRELLILDSPVFEIRLKRPPHIPHQDNRPHRHPILVAIHIWPRMEDHYEELDDGAYQFQLFHEAVRREADWALDVLVVVDRKLGDQFRLVRRTAKQQSSR